MFTNKLLCLNLTHLIIESKLRLELDSFAKQMNINKLFSRVELKLFVNNLVYIQSYHEALD